MMLAFESLIISTPLLFSIVGIAIPIIVLAYLILKVSVLKKKLNFQKRLSKKLRAKVIKLSKLDSERTSNLESAIQKSEEANRLKSLFLANMSHEIRTPLNGIMGFSELITDSELDASAKELYASQINQNSQNLLKLIDQIFHLSIIETGKAKINKSKFKIAELLEIVTSLAEAKIENSNKTIKFFVNVENPNYIINTDKEKLQLILNNLFDNAIKFTTQGIIEFTCLRLEKEFLFRFIDSGCGLNEDEYDLIFDPFMQGSETMKKIKGGSGLGLSNVKNYTILLGGKIWCERNRPNGSIFSFTIPAPLLVEQEIYKMNHYNLSNN